ncbi:4167_t:CDS:2 [Funneliformis caledonium]|uniref:4167_t:CDS:1 n=1 Tax=Funneliformis caledonium TaxID=1117310 RepID=A0A9N8YWN9_9GLOM|nr:4167_t:CDS:2 [Funneliformis caledonium]
MALRNKSIILFVLIAIYFTSTSLSQTSCSLCVRCPMGKFECSCNNDNYFYENQFGNCNCQTGGYTSASAFPNGKCPTGKEPGPNGIWVGHTCNCSN